jgi:hypothetical protein
MVFIGYLDASVDYNHSRREAGTLVRAAPEIYYLADGGFPLNKHPMQ